MADIKKAEFLVSNTDFRKCPAADKPEFAFIGRSNVGKSSLINMLTNRKNLAKTSGTPGKTQLINNFIIDDHWYMVDLPGYGWAQVSKKDKANWQTMIKEYLLYRENLYCVFLLIDSRHKLMNVDLEFMQWMGENEVPFVIVFTKADKLPKSKIIPQVKNYERDLLNYWEELPRHFITSSTNKKGKEEIINFILELNANNA